jgi:hypothetical protein
MLPPSSGSKNKPTRKKHEMKCQEKQYEKGFHAFTMAPGLACSFILKTEETYSSELKTKLRGLSPRENYTNLSDRRLSAKPVPTFADRGCHVVSVTNPYCRILNF